MNQEQFMMEVFRDNDTVTVSAKELQKILIDKETLLRRIDSIATKNKRLAIYIEDLELKIEKLQDTHITLDLKV